MNIKTFFEEKQLPYMCWEIKGSDGEFHIIDSDFVIDAILLTKGLERKKIEGTLSVLDFRNMPIMGYLKHLAEGLVYKRK